MLISCFFSELAMILHSFYMVTLPCSNTSSSRRSVLLSEVSLTRLAGIKILSFSIDQPWNHWFFANVQLASIHWALPFPPMPSYRPKVCDLVWFFVILGVMYNSRLCRVRNLCYCLVCRFCFLSVIRAYRDDLECFWVRLWPRVRRRKLHLLCFVRISASWRVRFRHWKYVLATSACLFRVPLQGFLGLHVDLQ